MRETASRTARRPSPEGLRLGERLRQLRVAAGLTQSELAGDRFSKEYVSQIERGKTRPTQGTIEWLADRLGVDAGFLANGVATDERTRLEGALARAEALYEAQEDEEAAAAFEPLVRGRARDRRCPSCRCARSSAAGSPKMRVGDHRAAVELLNEARAISEAESFSDVERADVLFRLGGCRYQLNSVQTALALFNEALGLAERSGLPCDALKANILSWRSRCWQRQRDFEAARDDVERALELSRGRRRSRARSAPPTSRLRSSPTARATGCSRATTPSGRARRTRELADRVHVSQLTNNLGGLNFLLGNTDEAVELLKESFAIALELGRDADAGRAVSSLAQVHLRTGNVEQAEEQARHALDLLDGRVDYVDEIGSAQLVLGRALLEQDRLDEAEAAFAAAEDASASSDPVAIARPHGSRAATWQLDGGTTNGRPSCTGRPQRLYRTSASSDGRR